MLRLNFLDVLKGDNCILYLFSSIFFYQEFFGYFFYISCKSQDNRALSGEFVLVCRAINAIFYAEILKDFKTQIVLVYQA